MVWRLVRRLVRSVVLRRLGLRPSSPPRPRLLRSGKRQSLYATLVNNRLRQEKRHRISVRKRGRKKLINDQIQRNFRIDKDLDVSIVHQIIKPRRTHRRHKVIDHIGEQTGLLFCKVFVIQIVIRQIIGGQSVVSTVISGKYGQIQRFILDRILFRKVILRQQPFIIFVINDVLKTGKR